MNQWYGKIGFNVGERESSPGVWTSEIEEREYYGEILRVSRRFQTASDKVTDDVSVNNQISILMDPYIQNHLGSIVWVDFMGYKWKVSDVEVAYPRLTLSVGVLYNADASGVS